MIRFNNTIVKVLRRRNSLIYLILKALEKAFGKTSREKL
jgi:hypothetical protein